MRLFKKNETIAARRELLVVMVDAADLITPKTGLALTVQILKAGGSSYTAIAGTSAEIGSTGTYKISLAQTDLGTEGHAMLKATASGAADQFLPMQVVAFDPYDAGRLGLGELHLAKAALVNRRTHVVETGVNTIKDDDGTTTLVTLTPSENDGVVTVTPS